MDKKILNAAKTLWNYHNIASELVPADLIMVLGSHDTRVAARGADLYLEGYSNTVLFSGGLGNLTSQDWSTPEADVFARIAVKKGVPKEDILIENESTNTGENIRFSYVLLQSKNIKPKSIILVQKPYMLRRTYASFIKQWPGENVDIFVTAPTISFEKYPNNQIPTNKVINIMVGDLQRIIEYPKKGFQIYQEVPTKVLDAYKYLLEKGYSDHLIR